MLNAVNISTNTLNANTISTTTLNANTGTIPLLNASTIQSANNLLVRTNTVGTPYNTATFNQDGTVSFLSTISAPRANITVGAFNTVNTTNMNTLNGSISTLNAGAMTTSTINAGRITNTVSMTSPDANITTASISTLGVNITANISSLSVLNNSSLPAITNVSSINALPIARYLDVATPVGTIIMFAGGISAIIPDGYLLCNGVTVSQTTYSTLYSVIGDNYAIFASAPVGQFTLPDMRGKAPFGAGSSQTSTYSFAVRGTTFANLASPAYQTPIDPATGTNYFGLAVLLITYIEPGQLLTVGQTISYSGTSRTITGIINYSGDTQGENNNMNVILILDATWTVGGMPVNTVLTVTTNSFRVGDTKFGSYTNQQGREVGIHTHGTVATSSTNNASAASGRSEPNFSQPINQPNGNCTLNSVPFVGPYAMRTLPNATFMNFLIRYQ